MFWSNAAMTAIDYLAAASGLILAVPILMVVLAPVIVAI